MSALPSNVLPFIRGKSETVVREIARWLLGIGPKPAGITDEAYVERLRLRLQGGVLASGVEQMLWHYAYGKPVEVAEVTVNKKGKLSSLTDEELTARIEYLLNKFKGSA